MGRRFTQPRKRVSRARKQAEMGFFAKIFGLEGTPVATPIRVSRGKRTARSRTCRVAPSVKQRISVKRNTRQLYQERGWRRRGDSLHGYYRTARGAFKGRIDNPLSKKPKFFIIKPPQEVLDGDHGPCFVDRGGNTFVIHFYPRPKDVNTGIIRVEHCILESFS